MQNSKKWSSLSSQCGQAMVEYVLMLVVSVAMVLALGYQLFKPFQTFLKAYMGDYVACLLETGELPSLGNQEAQEALSDEGCNARFETATLANGRPPKASESSSTSSSSSNSNNENSSDSNSSSGGSSETASSSASSSQSRNLLVGSINRRNGVETGLASNDKVTEIPLEGARASSFYNRRDSWGDSKSVSASKVTSLGIAGMTDEEKKKSDRRESTRSPLATGENFAPPPKKITIPKPTERVIASADDEPMTFGNFFRILLIAAIIIALVVVLGSQALKISKTREKYLNTLRA